MRKLEKRKGNQHAQERKTESRIPGKGVSVMQCNAEQRKANEIKYAK
jgi:hypothetical protein